MRIRRLQLIGFKSCMEPTVLEFPRGVTGIVGPNGCGKSNIVDALRWVLGEQSARHLRGQTMDDVIFAGNERYAPLGFAEVSITLDTEGPLPTIAEPDNEESSPIVAAITGAPEIEVTRRLFRSGESEYLINGRPCRLRDITELFLGTGVGTKAYSIIEQGRVGQIVNAKPEEVRLFIEEAAGTTLYRARKLAAERKIERTKSNLLRVSDIVAELERQAGSLRRQVRGAIRYQELKEAEEGLERRLARARFLSLRDRRESLQRVLGEDRDSEASAREAMREGIAARDTARERHALATKEADDARREYYESRARLSAMVQERRFLDERLREIGEARDSIEAELQATAERLAAVRDDGSTAARESRSCEEERQRLAAAGSAHEARLAETEQGLTLAAASLDEARARVVALLAEDAALANERASVSRQRDTVAARLTRLREEEASLGTLAQQLLGSVKEARRRLDGVVIEIDATAGGRNATAQRCGEISARRRGAGELVDRHREDVSSLESRYQSLKELSDGFAEYAEGVRTFMRNGAREASAASAVVADIIEVEAGYERAVAAVLADRLQYVVVPTADDGLRGARYLRESEAGRASFIPIDPPSAGKDTGSRALPPAGWSWLRAHVKAKDGYDGPVDVLLNRVAVGSSLPVVAAEWSANGAESTLVTLDGEVLEPTGVVTGGSGRPADEGMLARKAELRGIRIKLVDAEAKSREARAAFEALAHEAEESERALGAMDRRLHELAVERVSVEGELELQRQNLTRTQDRAVSLSSEINALVREEAQLREQLDALRVRSESIGGDRHAAEEGARILEVKRRSIESERDAVRTGLAGVRIREAGLVEQTQAIIQRSEAALSLVADLESRCRALEDRRARDLAESEAIAARLATPGLLVGHVEVAVQDATARCERLDAVVADARAEIERLDGRLDECSGRVESLREKRSQTELSLKEIELERASVESSLRERLGVGEADVVADVAGAVTADEMVEVNLSAELEQLRNAIRRLGNVNVGAVTELKEIEARLEELTSQRDDLERSIEDLRGTISQLNRLSRQRFKDTFDRVNEIFHKTFPRLFHGGKAWLSLTDENNLLETGVEIFVQPPGKRLGNIDLLSGGEKALTAVSLIFALFLHKPSPFCVLDEVDAPLDDANIGRFARMVDEMSERSQFLLITHNKKTMESCDTLYGVTMREPGVSKIVSVELSH